MADMIKFYKGAVASLPASGANGAIYITTDEGGIYLGTGTGMKRLGDFVQVANVAALPTNGAHENCLYYCVAENILAKWNGTEWKQVNKQPTAEEMKTLLGLGSMAYLSEVSESNLSAELAEKVNASAEGNHAHSNKTVLDGITAEKVAAWDAAEDNAKSYTDGKDSAMNTRVEALEEAIGEDGSVAAQITAAIEALDFTDTAVDGEYVSAVNEVDGKISVTRKALPDYTEVYDAKGAAQTAFDNAKAYADGLASNYDAKGAAAAVDEKLTAEVTRAKAAEEANAAAAKAADDKAAAAQTYAEGVAADLAGEVTARGEADTALGKRIDDLTSTHNTDKAVLEEAIADAKKAGTDANAALEAYKSANDTALAGVKATAEQGVADAAAVAGDLAAEVTRATGVEDAIKASIGTVAEGKTVVEMIADAQTTATYDDEEVRGLISDNAEAIEALEGVHATDKKALEDAIAAEKERAEGIEGGLETRLATVEANYLDGADKTELEGKIKANADAIELLTNGVDSETIDGVNDLIKYVKDHGTEVTGIKADIKANTDAIAAQAEADAATFETKTDASAKLTEAKEYADGLNTAMDERVADLEAINHDAYIAADTALKTEVNGYTDTAITNLTNGAVKDNADAIAELTAAVYTQEEVDAAIEAAVNEANTWGEF